MTVVTPFSGVVMMVVVRVIIDVSMLPDTMYLFMTFMDGVKTNL